MLFVVPWLMSHTILSCSHVALNTKYKHCYNFATGNKIIITTGENKNDTY